jgi:putative N6-adenine-specific DNA methylase
VDPASCAHTLEGARRSGVEDFIAISHKDFVQSQGTGPGSLVVLNPPYGVRMKTGDTINYKFIGDTLKQHYPESVAWIISADIGALKTVGLRPTRKHIVYNGALECQLSQYVISAPRKMDPLVQNPVTDKPIQEDLWTP